LEGILREARGDRLDVDPARVGELREVRFREPDALLSAAGIAQRELDRVHACELAFLMREGARRCESWDAVAAAAWRELVREALAAARADDLRLAAALPPGVRGLGPLDAVELARASVVLADHPLGRLELGLALHRRGDARLASQVLAAALRGIAGIPGVLGARPWPELLQSLARAQEDSGRPGRARLLRRLLAECRA